MKKSFKINELGAAKTHMALGKIKKQLDEPVVGIGKMISAVKKSQGMDVNGDGTVDDQDKQILDDLMNQLNNIVAYVGGAGSDVFNLNSNLRKNKKVAAAIDANLEEAILRGVIRELVKEKLRKN
jgi:hypothetical protein